VRGKADYRFFSRKGAKAQRKALKTAAAPGGFASLRESYFSRQKPVDVHAILLRKSFKSGALSVSIDTLNRGQ
jgi:hypothetical protein